MDDERLAHDLLHEYLDDNDSVEIVADCDRGRDAIEKINELEPDLVFLDVQMPGLDGFDVLERIKVEPFIIFCTAYDKYAIQAFEQNAIDYLLKPLDKRRFDIAVARAASRILSNDKNFEHRVPVVAQQADSSYPSHLFVQKSEKLVNLPVLDIIHLEASKDYTIISADHEQFVSSTGISKLETKLDPTIFFRVHRSTIINLRRLLEIEKHANGSLSVKMDNGKLFPISRSYAKMIKDLIV